MNVNNVVDGAMLSANVALCEREECLCPLPVLYGKIGTNPTYENYLQEMQ